MAVCLYLNGEGFGSASLRWEEKQLQVTELDTAALLFTLPSGWIFLLALHLSGPILKFPLRYVKTGTVQAADPTVYTASAPPPPTSACWQPLVSGCSLSR